MGTTKGTHGEQTDSNETIPDGGRRSVRLRWQVLSVTAGLLQPLHRSRGLYSTHASFIIMKMKGIMARHGIPEQVFSDNGPQFSCAEFAQFANTWGFVHSTSSPRYPQSNGLAEKAVQTAKRIVMKATASGQDPYITLLEYRTMPISDCGKSPAQLLMSRRLRSVLPSTPASLQPALVNPEDIQPRSEEKQDKQKTLYDRNARTRAGISEDAIRQKCQNPCRYLSRRPDTDEKELGRLPECSRHRENRRITIVQRWYKGRCHIQTHQSTSEETETLRW